MISIKCAHRIYQVSFSVFLFSIILLFFSSLLFALAPDQVLLKQQFKAGDCFTYRVEEKEFDRDGNLSLSSPALYECNLKVDSISPDGAARMTISEKAIGREVDIKLYKSQTISREGEKILRIKLLPNGEVKMINSSSGMIRYKNFILQHLPLKQLKIGETYVSSGLTPSSFHIPGSYRRETTVLSFGNIGKYDCVKINSRFETGSPDEPKIGYYQSERETYLAYKLGYPVINSKEKIRHEFANRGGKVVYVKEILVELVQDGKYPIFLQTKSHIKPASIEKERDTSIPFKAIIGHWKNYSVGVNYYFGRNAEFIIVNRKAKSCKGVYKLIAQNNKNRNLEFKIIYYCKGNPRPISKGMKGKFSEDYNTFSGEQMLYDFKAPLLLQYKDNRQKPGIQ